MCVCRIVPNRGLALHIFPKLNLNKKLVFASLGYIMRCYVQVIVFIENLISSPV